MSGAGRILSLGSVNVDFQVRTEKRPGEAETVLAQDFIRLGGGKAANVAVVARRLGRTATVLGCVGDDDLAEQALHPLRAENIGIDDVVRIAGVPTAVSMIAVPPDGKKHILLANNANDHWTADASARAVTAIRQAPPDSLLVVDYEVPAGVVHDAIEAAASRGMKIVLDPSFPERADSRLFRHLAAIAPNTEEAQALTGISKDRDDFAPAAVRALRAAGIALVCLKLSDGGCLLADGDRLCLLSAPKVEIVDATGAGDAFTGALAVAVIEGRPPIEAAAFAVAASSLTVTAYGSQPAYPDRARVDALVPGILQSQRPWTAR